MLRMKPLHLQISAAKLRLKLFPQTAYAAAARWNMQHHIFFCTGERTMYGNTRILKCGAMELCSLIAENVAKEQFKPERPRMVAVTSSST